MNKIAFLYPGQGSQKVGMGKSLLDEYPPAKDIFQKASDILDFDVEKLCVEGPEEHLTQTVNLQPSLLTLSWTITCLLKEEGISPEAVAGHSLGEYSAILAAGVVDFPKVLQIVKERARLMQKEGEKGKGGMAAVIGLDAEKVIAVCRELGEIEPVNFNCPGQVVVSGKKEKVATAKKPFEEAGAKKVLTLPVSGAFHSFLMRPAAEKFTRFIDNFDFSEPVCKVISNATGEYAKSAHQIKENLKLQMDHPVLWEKSMKHLLQDGFDFFVETGPGKVLQGLMRRINRKVTVFGVEDVESARELAAKLR